MDMTSPAAARPPLRPELGDLLPYPPGRPESDVRRELGLERIVKLASNENPLGAGAAARAALADALLGAEAHRYLDLHDLRAALARHAGVAPSRIIPGNGSDEIVILLALTFFAAGGEIVTSAHEFVRYKMAATMMGLATREVPLRGWAHDVEALAAAVGPRTRALFVANPTNPVGSMVPFEAIRWLAGAVPPHVLLVVDQAYHEYAAPLADYGDAATLLDAHPNLVVLRTFSKAHGLAALRVGYALAAEDLASDVERVRPPFNINAAGMAAAIAALGDPAHVAASVAQNERGKATLARLFGELGLAFVEPAGNFVLVEMPRAGAEVADALLRRGVIVRPVGGYGLPRHLRISVGTDEENAVFAEALRAVLGR